MNKIGLVIQREYVVRVKKKSFLWTTILVPIIIVISYAAIIAVSISGSGESNKIAVLDKANLFNGKVEQNKNDKTEYIFVNNETVESYKGKYQKAGYKYFLYIPPFDIRNNTDSIVVFGKSALSLGQKSKIERAIDKAIEVKRLQSANISAQQYDSIKSDITVETITGKDEKKSVSIVANSVAAACGVLIYIILLVYGSMVMRGVMEEKTNRIAEVIVSSVKPFQLMLGKIIGIGAVGLTQFAIWMVLIFILQLILPIVAPGLMPQVAAAGPEGMPAAANAGMFGNLTQGLQSLPVGLILFAFVFYFIGGYLLYASMFAAIGSVVSEDQQEAQQLVFPVMMPIILAFAIMPRAIAEPNSGLAVFGSLFPLTSPVVMMGRIMFDIPVYEIILSMVFMVIGVFFFTWLTAKIYRTGILLYGKKVTWKEMMKWAFRKS